MKVEKSSLQEGHKKFVALHKAHQEVEKMWVRNALKLKNKTKSSTQKKILRRAPASEASAVFHQSL